MPAKKASTKKKKKTIARKAAKTSRKVASKGKAKRASSGRKTSTKKASSRKATKKRKPKSAPSKGAKTRTGTRKASSKRKVSSKKMVTRASAPSKGRRASSVKKKSRSSKTRAPARASAQFRGSVLTGPVRGFEPYKAKRGEPYMSETQLDHFRKILLAWKRELMEEVDRTMLHMKDDAANFPDPNDRATQESEFGLELRTRDRERKLLKKIDSALQRIDDGSYGYCEETGDEIGLRRLEARPVATLCVEAQERRELAERQFRDREEYYR
jgi:RNA polymerase-binding transcription factor